MRSKSRPFPISFCCCASAEEKFRLVYLV